MQDIDSRRRQTYRLSNARRRAALRAHSNELAKFLGEMGMHPATIERAILFAQKDPESVYDFDPPSVGAAAVNRPLAFDSCPPIAATLRRNFANV
jgi:hypothetical protein